ALAAYRIISAEDRVLELGGGIGVVASYVWTKRRCTYHIYEANPYLLPSLHGTLALNDARAVIVPNAIVTAAIPDIERGWAELGLHEDFWQSSTIATTDSPRVTVPVVSFSEVVARYRPTVIISDIEGGEIDIFAVSPLDSVHSIVIEIHPGVSDENDIANLLE